MGVLDGPLPALPVGLGLATRSGVARVATMSGLSVGLSLPLALVSVVAVAGGVAGVAHHGGAVVHLLADLVALLGHHVPAVLDVGGVHDGVVLGVADLVRLLVADSLIDGVVHGLAVVGVGGVAGAVALAWKITTGELFSNVRPS